MLQALECSGESALFQINPNEIIRQLLFKSCLLRFKIVVTQKMKLL